MPKLFASTGPGTTFCQLAGFKVSADCSHYHSPGFAVNEIETSGGWRFILASN